MKRNSHILVYGSSNTDLIVDVKHLPRPGETVLGGAFRQAAGGKGANQAVAAARAGGVVSLVARVGQDEFGDGALEGLRAVGVDVCQVVQDARAASGVAFIHVAESGENCIAVASGANALLSPADVEKSAPLMRKADVAIAQLEIPLPAIAAAAALAQKHGVPFILNPAPAPAVPIPQSLIASAALVTPNESECEALTGVRICDEASMEEAARILLAQGAKAVAITLGKRGVFLASDEGSMLVDGFSVKAADTTGAGDTFNGALAVALAEGWPLAEAARFGNAAAALSVTRTGAQSSPHRGEIDEFLKQSSSPQAEPMYQHDAGSQFPG